jgi:hypothetical protein
MSDNWIILIPTRPDYVPDPHARETARALLAEFLPQAEVTAPVSSEIEFVHPFENWSGVRCPLCHADIETTRSCRSAKARTDESSMSSRVSSVSSTHDGV